VNATCSSGDGSTAPFDTGRLDGLMDDAGIDVLVVNSKHNVRYLLGGYQFMFFSAFDALAHSRYLPLFIYEKGRPERAAYVASRMEGGEHKLRPLWTPNFYPASWGTLDATACAIEHLKAIGREDGRLAIEASFLPADCFSLLRSELRQAHLLDATSVLERLRALKDPRELGLLRTASELIAEAMLSTIDWAYDGVTKANIVHRLATEQAARGIHFDYCFLAMGSSHSLAVTEQEWRRGEVLSLDSGGNYEGYIGDICRMGVLGEPDAELTELLGEIETVQRAAFSRVRAGIDGRDMITRAESARQASKFAGVTDFLAHGMGLVAHEAPFLMTNHPIEYQGVDAERPLEAGMVISIETTMKHPTRGLIKLEDTVAVTADGYEMFGGTGRGWNIGGSAAQAIAGRVG
jgi:Xaa-Pro dipeptidase